MKRGWCPSLHEPMATGDGLLLRVKPPLGQLSAPAARALAAACPGAIELTNRGALQFRGFDPASARRFADRVVDLGLAVADRAAERRRTVLVSPLAGCDPAVAPATLEIARALEAAIVREEGLAGLPGKFRFAVCGGGALPLGNTADVTVRVGLGGCWVNGRAVGFEQAIAAALEASLAAGRGQGEGGATHTGPGLSGPTTLTPALSRRREREAEPARAAHAAVGPLAGGRAFGAGVRFGAMEAATLAGLADVAEMGDGVVRLTPWRAVVIAGVSDPAPLAALGLIVAADDPGLRVSACSGRPGCASASVATREVARGLRPGPGVTVHVSGCAKGCAHPGPAELTFVGRDGLFDLVRAGQAGDTPVRRGLAPDELSGTL